MSSTPPAGSEAERWFAIEQDRKRARRRLAERAQRRARKAVQREQALQRAFVSSTPKIKMQISAWETDEHGNLSRKIYAE